MCTKLVSAFAGIMLLAWNAVAAQAVPAAPPGMDYQGGGVTLVAGGCGPGRHRDLDDICRRDAVLVEPLAPVLPPIVDEPGHLCPFGTRWVSRRRACIPN